MSSVVEKTTADRMRKFDDVEVTNKWAELLKKDKKCDIVIALTHLGLNTGSFNDQLLVNGTRNIDLVVGGHSHTFLEEIEYVENLDGTKVPVVQDGCWGLYVGKVLIRGR